MMSELGGPAIIEQEPRLGDSHLHLAAALPAQVQVSLALRLRSGLARNDIRNMIIGDVIPSPVLAGRGISEARD